MTPDPAGNTPWTVLIHLWMRTAWRRRYLIALLVLLMPILGLAVGSVRPKVYESSMKILIQETAKHNPILEDLAVETRIKDRIAALDALLHSRHVLLGVAVDLKWIDDDTDAQDREDILFGLSRRLRLRLIGDELVELSYKQNTVADIDKVLIAVAQRFMEKVLAPERSAIAGSVKFLEEQITGSAEALATAEQALSEFMSANANSLPELHSGNVRRLADLRLALSERRTALEGAQARYQELIGRLSQNNPVVVQIEQQIVKMKAELASLRARYTNRHSAVQAALNKLERLKEERAALLSSAPKLDIEQIEKMWTAALRTTEADSGMQYLLVSQIESLRDARTQVIDLTRQAKALKREVTTLDDVIKNFGETEKRLRALQSNVNVKRDVHDRLRERAEMARVTGALGKFEAPERVKVIDKPSVPTRPAGFPPVVYAIMGLFAAFGAGASLVAFEEMTDTTLRTRAQTNSLAATPVLARVPHLIAPSIPSATSPSRLAIRPQILRRFAT